MSTGKTIVRNISWMFFSSVISNMLGLFIVILIARKLGDVNLGIYSYAIALFTMSASIFEFGSRAFMTREVARNKKKTRNFLFNVFTLRIIFGILAFVSAIGFLLIFEKQVVAIRAVVIFGMAVIIDNVAQTFRSIFNAHEKMKYEAIVKIVERVIAFSIGAFLMYRGYGIVAFSLVLLTSSSVYFLLLYILTNVKVCFVKLGFNFKFWKHLIKKSIPFWLTLLFIKVYFSTDSIMLSVMKGYDVTGWYNAAYKLIAGLFFIPFVINTAVFPALSRAFITNKERLRMIYQRTFKYLFMIALPLAIGTTILASRIILFIYKEEFTQSSMALQILIWAGAFMFVNYIIGSFLQSINKQILYTYTTGICALFNVILNMIFIPVFSYKGAAVVTVFTELLNFCLLYYFSRSNNYKLPLLKIALRPFIAASFMFVFIFLFKGMHLLLLVPLSSILYFLILFLLKYIDSSEIELIKSIIK